MTTLPISLPIIPEPAGYPLIGHVTLLHPQRPVQSMMAMAQRMGEVFRLRLPGNRGFTVVSSHRLAHELCDEQRFHKIVHRPLELLRDFSADGLFTAHDHEPNWGRAHRILMPAFSAQAMRNYFDGMRDMAEQLVLKWERLGSEAELDVADNMTRLTLDTIALCGFDYRFNSFYREDMHAFVHTMIAGLSLAGARARRPDLFNRLHWPSRRRAARYRQELFGLTDRLIAARRRAGLAEGPQDLLHRMLAVRDPQTGEALDDATIRHELLTFLVAGH